MLLNGSMCCASICVFTGTYEEVKKPKYEELAAEIQKTYYSQTKNPSDHSAEDTQDDPSMYDRVEDSDDDDDDWDVETFEKNVDAIFNTDGGGLEYIYNGEDDDEDDSELFGNAPMQPVDTTVGKDYDQYLQHNK